MKQTTLKYIPKENENTNFKRYMEPSIYDSIIYTVQAIEPTFDRVKKTWCVCIYIYIYIYIYAYILQNSSIKRERNSAIFNNMDGPRGCYIYWKKLDRENKCWMLSLYMECLK